MNFYVVAFVFLFVSFRFFNWVALIGVVLYIIALGLQLKSKVEIDDIEIRSFGITRSPKIIRWSEIKAISVSGSGYVIKLMSGTATVSIYTFYYAGTVEFFQLIKVKLPHPLWERPLKKIRWYNGGMREGVKV